MFNLMKDMMLQMFSIPVGWRIWLAVLMFVNFFMPFVFYQRIEAQVIFLAAMIGVFIGLIIFKMQGFTRLLGLMHIPWFPLLYFLWSRLNQISAYDVFKIWISTVVLLNTISLVIDVIDVIRYIAGDRKRAEA
jgi:hypothetical protein